MVNHPKVTSLPCNHSAITEVHVPHFSYCTAVLVHSAASVYSLPKHSSFYYKKNIAEMFRMYMYSTESSLVRSIDYTESSIPYYCYRHSHLVWLFRYSTQPFLSRLILLFSLGGTVGPFVHSKDHCYMYFFMSMESVTPAPRVCVKRSLDDDVNEAQSQQPPSNCMLSTSHSECCGL